MTPGTSLAGKYRLLRPLGKGSMGEVWAALHTAMGREVAVKLLNSDNPDLAARLRREALACGRLEHPNIVRVYDIGETSAGQPFLIMELLMGETLARRMARRRRFEPAEAVGLALDVARALRAAHAASIVHRDLKPANIYLHRGVDGEDEQVKVLDFGVSKILTPDETAFTVTGMLVGSPAYMSPEQAQASREIDARADLWSVGVLLFEMLTGRWPYQSTAPVDVVGEILAGPLPALSSVLPGVDPRLDEAVRRCLTRELDQRMPSAAALIDALRPIVESKGAAAPSGPGLRAPLVRPAITFPSDDQPTTAIDRSALGGAVARAEEPRDDEATSLLEMAAMAAAQEHAFETARTRARQHRPPPPVIEDKTERYVPPAQRKVVVEDPTLTKRWEPPPSPYGPPPAPVWPSLPASAPTPPAAESLVLPWARPRRPRMLLILAGVGIALVILILVVVALSES